MVDDPYEAVAENGLEQCPWCGDILSAPHRSPKKPVVGPDGTEHGSLYTTPSGEGPYYHPDCWDEREAEEHAENNETLGDFAEE